MSSSLPSGIYGARAPLRNLILGLNPHTPAIRREHQLARETAHGPARSVARRSTWQRLRGFMGRQIAAWASGGRTLRSDD